MRAKNNWIAFVFLAPNFVGFLIFTSIPVVAAFALSLFEWNLFQPPTFVGLRNFVDLLGFFRDGSTWQVSDPRFWKYLGNTLFLMMNIPISMSLSLSLALLLNQKIRGRVLFRTIFYLPTICSGIGIMLLWMWIYNPEFGLANYLLSLLGIKGPLWLKSYHLAKPSLMLMGLWGAMGGTSMILYLAGLQGISPSLYEAAQMDGANAWHRFRHITFPMLAPTTFFIFITSVIGGFQGGFQAAYVMTKGGPDGATSTISYYIYNHAFQWFNMGYAAAIAVVLFGLVATVTLINWKFGGRNVSYT
ncbi:MAG: sugar ABC transporter permease [Lentisphaerae bacterium]|jgi:multiple sugar transport system permease protein|nr:sugar ABC transporter permease [Lentisphaerota bacterium]MBT4823470.1 sugar ABC transporter permease [Lentisphaerota bacterium]MBT5606277.1 sugar ABC transporter permease [Lentisphaerota bacterium]MBT7059383.1 sugar ABC transporter permease [Lentisphaerota bacterium]MBT7848278.1 sugar ABC transporter permease [Lentisphaerota bacterium]